MSIPEGSCGILLVMDLYLPRELTKGDITIEAHTAADYWNLVNGRGFTPVELSPQEKAARTRKRNEAEKSDNPDENPDAQAGTASA